MICANAAAKNLLPLAFTKWNIFDRRLTRWQSENRRDYATSEESFSRRRKLFDPRDLLSIKQLPNGGLCLSYQAETFHHLLVPSGIVEGQNKAETFTAKVLKKMAKPRRKKRSARRTCEIPTHFWRTELQLIREYALEENEPNVETFCRRIVLDHARKRRKVALLSAYLQHVIPKAFLLLTIVGHL